MPIYYATQRAASCAVREANWTDLEQALAVPITSEKSASFIMHNEGQEVLGLLLAAHTTPPYFGYPTIHIGSISVKPGHENNGIGTRLLKNFVAYAKKHSEDISLVVNEHNQAISLYERFGFHAVDVCSSGEALKMLRPHYPRRELTSQPT